MRADMRSEPERPEAPSRVAYLDGWRGLAILALLLGHFVGPFGVASKFINAGRLGVELFFVLSGLLMGNLLFVKKVTIGSFYKRRISRIFPALYAFLVGITLWLYLSDREVASDGLLAVVGLYYNYYAAIWHKQLPGEYAQIWSLCIEEHAYVVLSLIAVMTRRYAFPPHRVIWCVVLLSWVLAVVYSAFTDWSYYRIFWRTEVRLPSVFVSAGLVCWMAQSGRVLLRGWIWLAPLTLGLLLQTIWVPDLVKYSLGTALLAVAATHLSVAPVAIRAVLANRGLVWFGVLSYSIYLWQQPFKELRENHGLVTCLVGAIAFGSASFYLLESPARRFLNAHWTRQP